MTEQTTKTNEIAAFLKKNAVMVTALLLAIATSCVVPVDRAYLCYFDLKTLTCLFCVLAVVCALKNIRFFYMLARKVVHFFKNARLSILALVYITFIGSMLIANDMALLTFLPLGYLVLKTTGKEKYMAFTFIMQNIAANLGGMLTPFGNPQNLYLYTKFSIPNGEFVGIMAPPFALSVILITLCCILFVKPEPLSIDDAEIKLDPVRTAIYLALFALSMVIVFRVIPFWIGLIVIPLALLILDRKALAMVDYPLLLTFVLLRFCRKYGADRAGTRVFLCAFGEKYARRQRALLPVHQQRALRDFAFAVYDELPRAARRREHRRRGHADRVACKSDYLPRIREAQPRKSMALYRRVFSVQLCVFVRFDTVYAILRIKKNHLEWFFFYG